MSLLRTSCPTCDELQTMDPAEVILHISDDGIGRYVFACALCSTMVSRELASRSLDLLIAAGVTPIDTASAAAEPGPARLTLDDLLDLHQLLSTDSWFEQLVAMGSNE